MLGIVCSSDRLIGYAFIGAGKLIAIISAIKSRNEVNARTKPEMQFTRTWRRVLLMRCPYALLALGVLVCLIEAFLMGWGDSILGDNHAGIATVIGIVGIGIISTFKKGGMK